jgi:hypothetical protein
MLTNDLESMLESMKYSGMYDTKKTKTLIGGLVSSVYLCLHDQLSSRCGSGCNMARKRHGVASCGLASQS